MGADERDGSDLDWRGPEGAGCGLMSGCGLMIDKIDGRLQGWAAAVVKPVPVSLSAPDGGAAGQGVSLYLMAIARTPATPLSARGQLQMTLRYLVTAWSERPEDGHRILGDLVVAAADSPDLLVDLEPIPVEVWRAFGVVPRPAFTLEVPFRLERPGAELPRGREPMDIRAASLRRER